MGQVLSILLLVVIGIMNLFTRVLEGLVCARHYSSHLKHYLILIVSLRSKYVYHHCQMRKLENREVKQPAGGHTARSCQSWDLKPAQLVLERLLIAKRGETTPPENLC